MMVSALSITNMEHLLDQASEMRALDNMIEVIKHIVTKSYRKGQHYNPNKKSAPLSQMVHF